MKYRIEKDFDNIRIIKNFGDLGKELTDYANAEIINANIENIAVIRVA